MSAASARCESCGTPNDPGAEFCISCGAYLEWSAQADDAEATDGAGLADQPDPLPPVDGADQLDPEPAPAEVPTVAHSEGLDQLHAWLTDPNAPRPGSRTPPPQSVEAPAPSPPPAPTPPRATESAVPAVNTLPTAAEVPGSPGLHPACRECGRMNDNRLRFCSKCGNALVLTPSGGTRVAPTRVSWWDRHFGSEQRAQRRAYRRSLPPFYRWRPVLVGGTVAALAVAGGFVLVSNQAAGKEGPVHALENQWYLFTQDGVAIEHVTAFVPGSSLARDTSAAALSDDTFVATTMEWTSNSDISKPCTVEPSIELHWDIPERIRWIAIRPGLPMFDSTRGQENRPHFVEVSTGDPHRCIRIELNDKDERQQFSIDTADPRLIDPPTRGRVSVMRFALVDAFPPSSTDNRSISITEIKLFRAREACDAITPTPGSTPTFSPMATPTPSSTKSPTPTSRPSC